jgi:UDP-3-O-[3-hydroxymyristoyl] N-acetylglucosamine deacetylase / 3-hydroxyacyl-[acyl-carrier-protein] dehydratase
MKQRTLKRECRLNGRGLHTGEPTAVCLKPAPADSGICLKRVDLQETPAWRVCGAELRADQAAGRCTMIGRGETAVQTVEHLLCAFSGLGIDNAFVEVDGPEIPGMDGSALPFVQEMMRAGYEQQDAPRREMALKAPIARAMGDASITIFPAEDFKITYVLDYPQAGLSPQVVNFHFDEKYFIEEIAPARTFCLRQEAEALQKAGFGKGADTQNTLVMTEDGPLDNTLRFDDECARHKVADLLGDLGFLGRRIRGHIFAFRSGHYLNAALVKAMDEANEKAQFPPERPVAGSAAADITRIMEALPHRYPFLLVDRIMEMEPGKRAVGLKNLTMNELFFQGHFPGRPIMPGVLMIEAMAQVGGVLLKTSAEHRDHIGLFMSVNNAKFRRTAGPGDQLIMEVEVVRDRTRMASIRGVASVAGQPVVEADMMFSFLDRGAIF